MAGKNWSPTTRYIALITVGCAVGWAFWFFRDLIRPLIIAALFAYTIYPLVQILSNKTRIPHRASVIIVYVLSLLTISSIPAIVTPVIIGQIEELEVDFVQLISNYESFIQTPFYFREWIFYPSQFLPDISGLSFSILSPIAGGAFRVVEFFTKNISWVLVILVVIYYLLQDWDKLGTWLLKLPPKEYQDDIRRITKELEKTWSAYIRSQLLFMIIVGVLDAIAWLAIGLPGAIILAFITGLTSIVPEMGAFFSGFLSILVALLEGSNYIKVSNLWFAVIVLILYLVMTNIKNIWIRPIIIGRGVHIHEGIVFVVVLGALIVDGPLAAFISVPLLVSALIVGRYLRRRIYGLPPFPQESKEENSIDTG